MEVAGASGDRGALKEAEPSHVSSSSPSASLWDAFPSLAYHIPLVHEAIYIPNYVTEDEQELLLRDMYTSKWTQLKNRRLQNLGGMPNSKGMLQLDLPNFLKPLCQRLSQEGGLDHGVWASGRQANHILINEYEPNQGIMAHEDGPVYEDRVAILSLKSGLLLEFKKKKNREEGEDSAIPSSSSSIELLDSFSLYLEPKSLLVFTGDLYHNYLHSIEERTEDVIDDRVRNRSMLGVEREIGFVSQRQTRISLTIRVVKKVIKANVFRLK